MIKKIWSFAVLNLKNKSLPSYAGLQNSAVEILENVIWERCRPYWWLKIPGL